MHQTGLRTMLLWLGSRWLAVANRHLSLLAIRTLRTWLISTVYRKALQQQQGENLINLATKKKDGGT